MTGAHPAPPMAGAHPPPPMAGTHPPPSMAGVRPVPAQLLGRSFAVNPSTTVMPLANRSGFLMDHQRNDGSRLVISQRALPSGQSWVSAYRQSQDARSGTVTRTYANGQRIVEARDYRSRGVVGGPVYVNYSNGLRAATLPNGQPLYRESFYNDHGSRFLRRLVYASYFWGRPYPLRSPVVRIYEEAPMWGYTTYVYRPEAYRPAFYGMFYAPLAQPVMVSSDCALCPPGYVVYERPVTSYDDPVMLLGDLQISGAIGEGLYGANEAQQAEMQEFRGELSQLSQQLDAGASANPELRSELATQKVQARNLQQQLGATGMQQVSEQSPMKIPEAVRTQVRKQVRLSVAQHQNGKPLMLNDILASGYASIWLFQASEPLTVRNVNTGEDCALNAGDLTSFAQVPTASSALAQLNVVTSRPGSCPEKTVVETTPDVLQDMLNGFSQRVEGNMQRVSECSNPSAKCTRL